MFVASDLVLDVPAWIACDRLCRMIRGGGLAGAAAGAYEDGLEGLIRVGPFGDAPGASKLVRVRFLDPVHRDGGMTVGMRWEATGPAGGLFPVLDADISLAPDGDGATRFALVGSYRPPFGHLGIGLDRAILTRVATATVRAVAMSIATALVSPSLVPADRAGAIGPVPPAPATA